MRLDHLNEGCWCWLIHFILNSSAYATSEIGLPDRGLMVEIVIYISLCVFFLLLFFFSSFICLSAFICLFVWLFIYFFVCFFLSLFLCFFISLFLCFFCFDTFCCVFLFVVFVFTMTRKSLNQVVFFWKIKEAALSQVSDRALNYSEDRTVHSEKLMSINPC